MSTGVANPNCSSTSSVKSVQIFNDLQGLLDEGSLFVATNATPGTAVATTTSVVDDAATQSSTHGQASPVMLVQNQQPAGGYNIYPLYLKMTIGQVPTSATNWHYALRLDPSPSKLTTAGTVITPNALNLASGTTQTKAYINFGAITTVIMSSSGKLIGTGMVDGAIPVQYDEWLFNFGSTSSSFDQIGAKTAVKRITIPTVPVVIPPQWFWTLEMWGASNAAAPSWEFEFVYAERPTGQ